MTSIAKEFRVTNGKNFSLKDYKTDYTADYNKEGAAETLKGLIAEISDLQEKLYAEKRWSVLAIFQAMDAAGKDSAIAHTMSGINPQGCQVYSFKQPSTEEYEHDFLWRHYKALPERGRFGIHNRSHYENVLVTKVHPEYILNENLPDITDTKDISDDFWKDRYKSICHFENHLHRNGTVIIKFFLHLSKDEQLKRFMKRLDDPSKNWKFAEGDLAERERWKDYMQAYEDAITHTATEHAPWYILPADKKWFTRIAISTILLETLKNLHLQFPKPAPEAETKFDALKAKLLREQ
ncbi:polyphosphate kinase 2 family protein [Mucilaginibacter ginkgonis]|uniref:Polyphosphate kinase 2 family protein n=1 Tax=Mucilaginibacter ginkgonis TaxID=2682091 RepID=A0A6I4IN16_9SPHI|nr:polyphosphate kinase 2 family protein [Mucilaginibacter ginkgonis]QQL50997.1 polyphosphate kinase 2 family protein [Mucilaginibacter ginkgonis]